MATQGHYDFAAIALLAAYRSNMISSRNDALAITEYAIQSAGSMNVTEADVQHALDHCHEALSRQGFLRKLPSGEDYALN